MRGNVERSSAFYSSVSFGWVLFFFFPPFGYFVPGQQSSRVVCGIQDGKINLQITEYKQEEKRREKKKK